MKLNIPKRDFFKTVDNDFDFCIYLKSKGRFILKEILKEIQELDKNTKINYDLLSDRIREWENQGFIEKNNIATLGGPKYEYYYSKKALEILNNYKSKKYD